MGIELCEKRNDALKTTEVVPLRDGDLDVLGLPVSLVDSVSVFD